MSEHITVSAHNPTAVIHAAEKIQAEYGGFRLSTQNNNGWHSYQAYTIVTPGRMIINERTVSAIQARAAQENLKAANLFRASGAYR